MRLKIHEQPILDQNLLILIKKSVIYSRNVYAPNYTILYV